MSSTYVVGKQAAACVDENGVLFYLLSEQSYESNVQPRIPHWSARFFGRYEDCISRVIRWSSDIEGGMLRGEAKTSTAYIKQWRERLAAPVRLEKTILSADFRGGVYGLPEASREPAMALATQFGIDAVNSSTFTIDLERPRSLAFLSMLLSGDIEGMLAWRFFRHPNIHAQPAPGLGTPVPKAVPADLDGVTVYRIAAASPGGDDNFLISRNGDIRGTGWDYSTMQSFITSDAVAAETLNPGSAEGSIRAFRKIVHGSLALPAGTQISIRKPQGDAANERWALARFERLCTKLGVSQVQTVDVTACDVTKAAAWSDLLDVAHNLVSYRIDAQAAAAAVQLPLEV